MARKESLDEQTKKAFQEDPRLAIFAGEGAATADLEMLALAKAKTNEGEDPRKIWRDTGWWKAKDGKWRFEIDDRAASIVDGQIVHAELEKAYPGAFDEITVSVEPLEEGLFGSFDPNTKKLKVSSKLSAKDQLDTALHELQHYVQEKEGFESGSNPLAMAVYNPKDPVQALKSQRFNIAENFTTYSGKSKEEIAKDLKQKTGFETQDFIIESPSFKASSVLRHFFQYATKEQIEKLTNAKFDDAAWQRMSKARESGEGGTQFLVEAYKSKYPEQFLGIETYKDLENYQSPSLSYSEGFDMYESVLGEAEARGVPVRKDMEPEQRRMSYPEDTYLLPEVGVPYEEAWTRPTFEPAFAQGGVVDTTAAAFGMQPATSRGRNVPRRREVDAQTEEAFAAEEPKGIGYAELLLDNIIGLDNQYESTGEAFGKAFNEDELGTLKNMAVSAYEGAKEFVTSPIETTGNVVKDIRDSVYRLGSEDLDARIRRMYGIGYQDATDEQVTKAREAVIGDAVTASSLIPTAKGVKSVATVAADVMGPYNPNVLGSNLGNIGAAAKPKRPVVPRFERDTKQDAIAAFDEAFSLSDNPFEADMANNFFNSNVREFRQDRNIDVSDIPEQIPEEFGGGYGYLENIRLHDIIKAEVDGTPTEELIDHFGYDPTPDNVAFVERMRSSLRADKEDAEFVEKYKTFLQNYPNYDPNDIITDRTLGSSVTLFRSPIESVIQQLEYPRDGIKGAQFLKELKDNPDVRDSEVAGIGLDIDPQKRYTQQELMDAVSGRLYDVSVNTHRGYGSYQRQHQVGLVDPEKDYFELTIDATPRGDNPGFKATSQHYGENTLAHTRASVRSDTLGDYILVEEMQSDLLQKGFDRTPVGPSPDNVYSQFQIRLHESEIEGILKASPEEIQKGMSMAVLREEMNNLTGKDFENADDALSAFAARSTEGEWNSYKLFRTIHKDYLKYDPNVPVDVAKEAFNDIKDYITKKGKVKRNVPPIAKTEESVRLAIDALMAEGQKRNVSRIVIPPFEKIVEARFRGDPDAYNKALDPKSGFYATYVTSVNKVLDKYKKEFGDDFAVIQPYELQYGNDYLNGIEIDFSGLLNKGYNLTRPRFAQGGMVDYNTETQMNRLMQEGGIADDGMRRDPVSGNEVPPGSMAEEVRDDIPAQLSSGEYVVPADVLRYYGVAFFEKLRAEAKRGLAEMEAGGRIGGEPVAAPMRGMEYDDDELDDEDEMMLQQVIGGGMAQGGMMMSQPQQAANYYGLQPTMKLDRQMAQAFQQGGVTVDPTNIQQTAQQFTSQFDPTKFKPGFMFDQPTTGTAAAIEMRTYVNAQGEIRIIPFQNGQPLEPIPEGFYPQGQVPATAQTEQTQRDDSGGGEGQEQRKSYTEYTAEDWNKYNTDRSFGTKMGQVIGGIAGSLIGGPIGGIAGSNLAAEAIARDGINAYNALNDFIGNTSKSDPNYQSLVDKRNEMYGAITAAQAENPGLIGGILQKIFGKPEINPPKAGQGAGAATTGGGGAAAPARDRDRAEPAATTGAAAAPAAGGRGTGATATRGTATTSVRDVTALEGPEATSTRSAAQDAARSYRESADTKYGALAEGGLMQKKRVAKKAAKKRPIKTTDA